MDFQSPWAAYQFDQAVSIFGQYVEGKLEERDKKGKRRWSLKQIFDGTAHGGAGNGNSLIMMFLASGADQMDA